MQTRTDVVLLQHAPDEVLLRVVGRDDAQGLGRAPVGDILLRKPHPCKLRNPRRGVGWGGVGGVGWGGVGRGGVGWGGVGWGGVGWGGVGWEKVSSGNHGSSLVPCSSLGRLFLAEMKLLEGSPLRQEHSTSSKHGVREGSLYLPLNRTDPNETNLNTEGWAIQLL